VADDVAKEGGVPIDVVVGCQIVGDLACCKKKCVTHPQEVRTNDQPVRWLPVCVRGQGGPVLVQVRGGNTLLCG
jgi:hypothetical protein